MHVLDLDTAVEGWMRRDRCAIQEHTSERRFCIKVIDERQLFRAVVFADWGALCDRLGQNELNSVKRGQAAGSVPILKDGTQRTARHSRQYSFVDHSAPRRRVSLVEEGTTQTVAGLIW